MASVFGFILPQSSCDNVVVSDNDWVMLLWQPRSTASPVGEPSMTSQPACLEYPQLGEYFSFAPELDQIN